MEGGRNVGRRLEEGRKNGGMEEEGRDGWKERRMGGGIVEQGDERREG